MAPPGKLTLALMLVFALAGCHAKYQVSNLSGASTTRLDKQKSVYVAVPQDGSYGATIYTGSGQTVAQSVASAFSKVAPKVTVGDRTQSNEEALASARKAGAGYLVVPVIAHWEHRATAWSGIPSSMAIRVTILDTTSGDQVSSTNVEGRSRIASVTSTSPESLLRDPLVEYVRGKY